MDTSGTSAPRPLRIGVIGCGRVAQRRHLPILESMRGVEIAAIADIDAEWLRSAGERHRVERRHSDAHPLIEDESIDAVIVSTPPHEHFEPARLALDRGKHVFIESPLALSLAHCDHLVELAAKRRVVAAVALNLRQHPMIQRAKRDVREGSIGSIAAIATAFSTPSRGLRGDPFPRWRVPTELGGSVFSECAVQFFDVWRELTSSEIDRISVECGTHGGPVSITARMSGKIVVGAIFSEYSADTSEIRLTTRDGTLALSHYRFNGYEYCPSLRPQGSPRQLLHRFAESLRALPRGLRLARSGGEYSETFRTQLHHFVHAIRNGGKSDGLASLEDGRASTAAVLAAFRSMEEARPVELSEILDEART